MVLEFVATCADADTWIDFSTGITWKYCLDANSKAAIGNFEWITTHGGSLSGNITIPV